MICGTQERSSLSQPSLPLLMGYCTCSSTETLLETQEEPSDTRQRNMETDRVQIRPLRANSCMELLTVKTTAEYWSVGEINSVHVGRAMQTSWGGSIKTFNTRIIA